MQFVATIIGVVAFLAWFVAAASWVMAVRNRAEGVTLSSLILNGVKAFDPDSFNEAGRVHQRRFLVAFAVFFVLIFVGAGVGILATSLEG